MDEMLDDELKMMSLDLPLMSEKRDEREKIQRVCSALFFIGSVKSC